MDPDSEAEPVASKKFHFVIAVGLFATGCNSNRIQPALPATTTAADTVSSTVVVHSITDSARADSNTIYLTFDDGPNHGTRNVLNMVDSEQVPVSMFVIGQQVYGSQWQTKLLDSVRNNHLVELANHSYTHAHNHFAKFYRSVAGVISDFDRCTDSLHLSNKIARTPARNIWRLNNISSTDNKACILPADSLHLAGYNVMGWDLEWHFDNKLHLLKTDDELVSQIDTLFAKKQMKIPGHLVLLMHDQVYADSSDAALLRSFISKLKSTGRYRFAQVSSYPAISK